jgi:nitric oxide reductase subunit B
MLVYGSGICLMDKIGGTTYSRSRTAFALYFLGLFNLMFNWGHHIYTLPTHDYVKDVSYAVSMTELILLARIIYLWKSSLDAAGKQAHLTAYRFVMASDRWVLLTLALAIAMSVPAINVYTHGTQVTVAHTMGATIGIDTFLLLACVVDLFNDAHPATMTTNRWLRRGLWIANNSLFVFWLAFIGAGIARARWQMSAQRIAFDGMMQQSRPWFVAFSLAGVALGIGLMMIVVMLLKDRLGPRRLSR